MRVVKLLALLLALMGTTGAQAAPRSRGQARCRSTIANAVLGMARAGLDHFTRCAVRRPDATDACANLSSAAGYGRATSRGSGVVGYFCSARASVLENYPAVDDPSKVISSSDVIDRVLEPFVRARLEDGMRAGLPFAPSQADRRTRRCRRAIGRAETLVALTALGEAEACQHTLDLHAQDFGIIAPECVHTPTVAVARAARLVSAGCAGLTSAAAGSCAPLPGCVVDAAVGVGHALARYSYGAKPDQRAELCGDGDLDPGEECDLGPANSDHGTCTSVCTTAKCGDGFVETGVEECDEGKENGNTGDCTPDCKAARCGDGQVQGSEECDDGDDTVPCDGCTGCRFDIYACPDAGSIDVTTTFTKGPHTYGNVIGGFSAVIGYSAGVSIPGTGFIDVGDPADPATAVVLLGLNEPGNIVNFYDGLVTFFDKDPNAPDSTIACPPGSASCLATIIALNQATNHFTLNKDVPFELVRAACTPGARFRASDFPCAVTRMVTPIASSISSDKWPACTTTFPAPLCVAPGNQAGP